MLLKKIIAVVFIATNIVYLQTTIAVLDFEAQSVSVGEVATLTDRFRNELAKTQQYIVLERREMEEVLKEQGFQQTGCSSNECVVEVGQLIGVQQMIGGSIGKVGNVYTVSARIIDVQSGKILKVTTYDHNGDISELLTEGMKQVVLGLVSGYSPEIVDGKRDIGFLYITSEPDSASVILDESQLEGSTPLMVNNLVVGSHTVKVKKNDLSLTNIIEINKELNSTVKCNLTALIKVRVAVG